MTMRSCILLIHCFLFISNGLFASHIVGDCGERIPWFDDPARLAVFDRSNDTLVTSIGE